MRNVVNYLGQLRIYSLIDLILLLVAAEAAPRSLLFWGAALLWVGFLAHLESAHRYQGRAPVPRSIAWILWTAGLVLFRDIGGGLGFIAFSLIYSKKNHGRWGLVSPLMRGLQTLVMVGAICGYDCWLPWLAASLVAFRNLLGDFRDSQEDAEERMRTWPVKFRLKSRPFAHLLGTFTTTLAWWLFAANLSGWLLAGVLIVEVSTYWLTPRRSNKNAAIWLQKILRAPRR